MGALPTSRPMTVEQFELLAERSDERLELIDGEVVALEMPKFRHQVIQARLYDALRPLVPADAFVCMELQFKLKPEFNLMQADLGVLSGSRIADAMASGYISGAPELIIEVLSPSNATMDMNRRRKTCFASGCLEFWLVDPLDRTVQVWTPDSVGREYSETDAIPSPLFGDAKLPVSQIFA